MEDNRRSEQNAKITIESLIDKYTDCAHEVIRNLIEIEKDKLDNEAIAIECCNIKIFVNYYLGRFGELPYKLGSAWMILKFALMLG